MVKLTCTVPVAGPLENVWEYFSRFEVVPEWDPNTKSVKTLKKTPQHVGSEYEVLTEFNGNETTVHYTMFEYKPMQKVALKGVNKEITAIDEIIFTPVNEKMTNVTYNANIVLNGFRWLFTPFILKPLNDLRKDAHKGLIKRSEEVFGKIQL